ncbi:MAG TPA: MlaD family protein [Thermoanaerobaculia bacterium]|nr:MlaD family protein [Thermoanaerobaculia bacterium]
MAQAVKVGIFMTVTLALLGWLILRVEDWSPFAEEGRRVDALFDSVEGLDDKAAVRVAGVRVGRVDGIRLDGVRARVTLLRDAGVELHADARASIANQGLLGDKFVKLDPGTAATPALAEGATLPGDSPVSFDQAMAKIEKIGDSIEGFLSGEGGATGGFGELIASIQATSDELRAVITENRTAFGGTVKNFERFSQTLAEDLPRLTDRIDRVLAQVDTVVGENREDLRGSMANLREITDRVQVSVDNLNRITTGLANGEGTLGKLLTSDEAHDELIAALGSVEEGVSALGDTLGRVQKLKLDIGMEAAYLSEIEDSRSAVRVDIKPKGDESPRLYRVELVNDPRGRVSEKSRTETVTLPDGSIETTTTDVLTRDQSKWEYTVMVGLPFADRRGQLWAGMIESSGGVRLDWGLLPETLKISFEAFDFSRELDLDPHLRLTAEWSPWRSLYVRGGYDDPLVDDFRSPFIGAGLRWSDDDLKYLFGSVPRF